MPRAPRVGQNLGHLVLQEIQLPSLRQFRIFRQERQGVLRGAETVHQQELRPPGAVLPTDPQNLLGDQIKECKALLHLDERFRLLQPHARAEPPIELDHAEFVGETRVGRHIRHVVQRGDPVGRFEIGFGDESRLPSCRLPPCALETRDRCTGQTGVPHFPKRRFQSVLAHGSVRPSSCWQCEARATAGNQPPKAKMS